MVIIPGYAMYLRLFLLLLFFFLYNNGVFQALAGVVKVFAYIQCRSSPIYCKLQITIIFCRKE